MRASGNISIQLRKNTLFSVAVVTAPVALLGGRANAETNAILAVRELLADASNGVWRYQIFNNTPTNAYNPATNDFINILVDLNGCASNVAWIRYTPDATTTNLGCSFTFSQSDVNIRITNNAYAIKPVDIGPGVTNEMVVYTAPGLRSVMIANGMQVRDSAWSLYNHDINLPVIPEVMSGGMVFLAVLLWGRLRALCLRRFG